MLVFTYETKGGTILQIPRNHKKYITVMMIQVMLIIVIEILAIYLSWMHKDPLLFIAGMIICFVLAFILSKYYYTGAFFKCSICDKTFKPSQKEFMISVHVKRNRVFTCPNCAKKVKCKEGFIYSGNFR